MDRYRIAEFGTYTLDLKELVLRKGRLIRISLRRQACRLLAFLVERHDQFVSRQEIEHHLWNNACPPDVDPQQRITWCIALIRRALGDNPIDPRYIATREGGYEFLGPVRFLNEPVIDILDEPLQVEVGHASDNAIPVRQEIYPPIAAPTEHAIVPASTDPARPYMAVFAVATVYAIAALGVICRAYGLTIAVFWIGTLVISLVYRRLPDTPTTKSLAALFAVAAMSYTASVTTLPEVMSTVINLDVIPPAAVYPLVMGLKYIPLFFVVLAYWVPFAYRRDQGLPASPFLNKAYLVSGILVLLATCVCVVSASGEDRIWQANLPGRWSIVLGGAVAFALNLAAWIAGYYYYKQESITNYWPLFSICAILYLPVAVTAFLVDGQFNRINQYYLDVRRPEAYVAANPDAANEVEGLIRGSLKAKVGSKLRSVLRDPVFREVLQHGTFYRQNFDEPFQVFDRAVILAYRRPSQEPHGHQPLVLLRLPKELADIFRFELVSEDK